MTEKIYRGYRVKHQGVHVTVTTPDKPHEARKLRVRLDLWCHSPDGFEWGYGGSGPAQLALALLADALGDDDRASRIHQKFKWAVTAKLARDEPWELTQAVIVAFADALDHLAAITARK